MAADRRVETVLACLETAEAVLEDICAEGQIPAPQLDALLERLAALADLVETGAPTRDTLSVSGCRWVQ